MLHFYIPKRWKARFTQARFMQARKRVRSFKRKKKTFAPLSEMMTLHRDRYQDPKLARLHRLFIKRKRIK